MIRELLDTNNVAELRSALAEMNPVDIAEEFGELEAEVAIRVFRLLPKDTAAEAFAYMSSDSQLNIVSMIKDSEINGIIDEMFLDDAVDFIEEMPANVVKRVLSNLTPGKREIINRFLKYPENSAGSIMTIEYVSLKEGLTVSEAFDKIRKEGIDKETIYTCYITDSQRKLVGATSIRALLLASPEAKIGELMERSVISAVTTDDQETLANDFRKYGLLAMPIVDNENRIVGIVTVDDVMEIQEEEATEDFEIMAAMSPSEEPYLQTSVLALTKNRVLWLLLLMLSATVTGSIMSGFEESLAMLPVLMIFIPMLMDTGGNAGSQSSTLIIRGMALDEIKLSDTLRVFWKELRVSATCGAVLAVANFLRILVMNRQDQFETTVRLGITVSLALFATVVLAKTVGCMLPIVAKKLKLDPAVMASPVITTIVDAGALLVYFAIAHSLMGI